MHAVVVYESMYGNTHLIAEAIAEGLRPTIGATVVPVGDADPDVLAGADLLVVGGPTHVHGMSRPTTRASAAEAAAKPGADLDLDDDAEGPGLREWFDSLDRLDRPAVAFDTRAKGPALLTGRASKGIARQLTRRGCELIAEPESFLVSSGNRLLADEEEHARRFGADLAKALATT